MPLVEIAMSDDMQAWSSWEAVGAGGGFNLPGAAYIKYRVTLATSDPARTPRLHEIILNDIPSSPYAKLGFSRPVILAGDAWEAVLENAYDIVATKEINGADYLEFKIPFKDPKRAFIKNEKQVQIVDDIYRIRTVNDEKGSNGMLVSIVYAEAAFYDLSFGHEKPEANFEAALASAPIAYALEGSGWSIGAVEISVRRTWLCQEKNGLAILRKVQALYGGDLVFDSKRSLVSLLSFSGKDSGALFAYRKNMAEIKSVTDTRSLITRLYAIGKNGMTFESINGGKAYVEDYSYTDEVRINSLDLSSFSNMQQMLEYAQMRLAEYSRPRVSYVMNAMDLSALTGYEHEKWALGDIVTVDDRDMDMTVKARIVRMQYNLQEPWKNVLELSTTLRELASAADGIDVQQAVENEIEANKESIAAVVIEQANVPKMVADEIEASKASIAEAVVNQLDVSQMVADEIEASKASIADAVVERLDVSQMVADEIEASKASIADAVVEQLDVSQMVADEIDASKGTIATAVIGEMTADSASIIDLAVTRLKTVGDDHIFIHEEKIEFISGDLVKAMFAFANIGGNRIPALVLGAGDGTATGSRGIIFKDTDSLQLGYSGGAFVDIGAGGVSLNSNGLFLLDLAGGEDGQALTKSGNAIIWSDASIADWGSANLVIIDHAPTEADVAAANENTLFVVYDINDPVARWGSSAFDTAKEQGYSGSKESYNDALTQVGNMQTVLDEILGGA
jgi:phage minor structural protein